MTRLTDRKVEGDGTTKEYLHALPGKLPRTARIWFTTTSCPHDGSATEASGLGCSRAARTS